MIDNLNSAKSFKIVFFNLRQENRFRINRHELFAKMFMHGVMCEVHFIGYELNKMILERLLLHERGIEFFHFTPIPSFHSQSIY